jgi:5-methyltetrahydropteroyltriglutamate--homocysteine methyltransferase
VAVAKSVAYVGHNADGSNMFVSLTPAQRKKMISLVTTKKPTLESKEALKRRIMEATRFIPLERLALNPQCGFASTEEGNLLGLADQEAKLRLVAETAREIWN